MPTKLLIHIHSSFSNLYIHSTYTRHQKITSTNLHSILLSLINSRSVSSTTITTTFVTYIHIYTGYLNITLALSLLPMGCQWLKQINKTFLFVTLGVFSFFFFSLKIRYKFYIQLCCFFIVKGLKLELILISFYKLEKVPRTKL